MAGKLGTFWKRHRLPLYLESLEDRVLPSLTPFPTLQPEHPLGSLMESGKQLADFGAPGETDSYSISVVSQQKLAILLWPTSPSSTLVGHMQLNGPGGQTVGSADASAAGGAVLLQADTATTAGTYEINVTSTAGFGNYALSVYLNASVDDPNVVHNSAATAQNLNPGAVALQGTADRLAVIGQIDSAADPEYYAFALAEGQAATLALRSEDGSGTLKLHRRNADGSTTLMAVGLGPATEEVQQVVRDFIAPTAGTYYAVVGGADDAPYDLVITRGAAFIAPPSEELSLPADISFSHQALGNLPGAPPLAAESEPNNDLTQANDLSGSFAATTTPGLYQAQVSGVVSYTFPSYDITDYFHILATPGDTLTIDEADSGIDYRYLYLYNSDGVQLSSAYGFYYFDPSQQHPHLAYTFGSDDNSTYTGDYYLIFQGYYVGSYILTVALETASPLPRAVYSFSANAGDALVIKTSTPGNSSGATDAGGNPLQSVNALDPTMDLIDPSGVQVASNHAGAPDGHNAQISYAVPTGGAGKYKVVIRDHAAAGGPYTVAVTGATASAANPPSVTAPTAADLLTYETPPTTFDLSFSEGIRADSINLAGFMLDGGATVTGVQLLDGDTIRFNVTVPNAAANTDRIYHYTLAAGAVKDLQGEGNLPFSGSFSIIHTGPYVVAHDPAGNVAGPMNHITFTFNEPIDPETFNVAAIDSFTGPGGIDIKNRFVYSVSQLTANQFVLYFNFPPHSEDPPTQGPAALGSYTLVLGPSIKDLAGRPLNQDLAPDPNDANTLRDPQGDTAPDADDHYAATFTIDKAPDLVMTAASAASSSVFLGDTVNVSYTVANHGAAPTTGGFSYDMVLLSDTPVTSVDPSQIVNTYEPGKLLYLNTMYHGGDLAARPAGGADDSTNSYTEGDQQIYIPVTAGTGPMYLVFLANSNADHAESDDFNPAGRANNVRTVAITVVRPDTDLVMTAAAADAAYSSGSYVNVSYTVANHGTQASSGTSITTGIFLTDTATTSFDPSQVVYSYQSGKLLYLTSTYHGGALASLPAGGIDDASNSFTDNSSVYIPTDVPHGPQYHLVFVADPWSYLAENDDIVEVNDTDNVKSVSIVAGYADLTVAYSVTTPPPTTGTAGQYITVSWVTTNSGNAGGAAASWYDTVYLSPTAVFNPNTARDLADFWVAYYVNVLPLSASESYTMSQRVFIPSDVTGDQYLFVVTDNYYNIQPESDETNNTASALIHFPKPDLTVSFPAANPPPTSVAAGQYATLPWKVTSQGAGTSAFWYDTVYLSPTATFDVSTARNLGNFYVASYGATLPLANGGSYTLTPQVFIPADVSGDQYLIVFTDNFDYQIEESETNNTASTLVHITRPDLTVAYSTTSPPPASANMGDTINVSWKTKNVGAAPTNTGWYDSVYLSPTATFDANTARNLGDFYVSSFGATLPLAANGGNFTLTRPITIPSNAPGGPQYLIVVTDRYGYQSESDETNNTVSVPITINGPDLIVQSAAVPTGAQPGDPPPTIRVGNSVNVSFTIKNQGALTANAGWYDSVYYSPTATFNQATATNLRNDFHSSNLAATSTYPLTNLSVTLPLSAASGTRYLLFRTDAFANLNEADETNNFLAVPINVVRPDIDLAVTSATAPATATVNQTIPISWSVKNQGTESTSASYWYDGVYLSNVPTFDNTAVLLTYYYVPSFTPLPLGGGASYTASNQQLTIPYNAGTGSKYLLFKTDVFDYQIESDDAVDADAVNNVKAVQITLSAPDLVVSTASAPATGIVSGPVTVNWTVANQGAVSAYGQWYDAVYISTTSTFDDNTARLLNNRYTGNGSDRPPLDPLGGADNRYDASLDVTIPSDLLPGSYYLFVKANNYTGYQGETDVTNNLSAAIPITLVAPDLVVSAASAPPTGVVNANITLTWTVTNQSNVAAPAFWYDTVYISSKNTFDNTARQLSDRYNGSFTDRPPLDPFGGAHDHYNVSHTFALPYDLVAGQQYLYVKANNYTGYQGESDRNNNVSTALPITIGAPDLVITAASAPTFAVSQSTINVTWTVANQGSAPAVSRWYDRVWISTKSTFDGTAQFLTERYNDTGTDKPPLDPQGGAHNHYDVSQNITLPGFLAAGNYYIFVNANYYTGHQGETDRNNNLSAALPITIGSPDLIVSAPTTNPTSAVSTTTPTIGQSITLSYRVTNQGANAAPGPWYDYYYLSSNATLDASDTLFDSRYTGTPGQSGANVPLASGATYSVSPTVTLPNTSPGAKFLLIVANGNRQQGETDNQTAVGANNVLAVPITVLAANLQASNVTTSPTILHAGGIFNVNWTDTNTSSAASNGGSTQSYWYDRVMVKNLTTGETLINQDVFYDPNVVGNGNIAPGDTRNRSLQLTMANGARGTGDIEITVTGDIYSYIPKYKTDGTTDTSHPFTIQTTSSLSDYPDLRVKPSSIAIEQPATPLKSGTQSVRVGWDDENIGKAIASGSYTDNVLVQKVSDSGGLTTIASGNVTGVANIAVGATSHQTFTFSLPDGDAGAGTIRVTITTNSGQTLAEFDTLGNPAYANNVDSKDVSSTVADYANLRVTNLAVTPSTTQSGQQIAITWKDQNAGTAAASTSFYDVIKVENLSSGQTLLTDSLYYNVAALGNLAAGATSATRQYDFTVPDGDAGVGNLRITVTTDYYGNIFEYDNGTIPDGQELAEADNDAVITATSTLADYSDLRVANLSATPTTLQSGGLITVSWNDRNSGAGSVAKGFYDRISVVNTTTGQTLVTIDKYYDGTLPGAAIPAGSMSPVRQQSFNLPDGAPGVGSLQISVTTDYFNQVFEYDNGTIPGGHTGAEANNSASVSATATLAAYPDLEVANLAITPANTAAGLQSGANVTITWDDKNSGNGDTTDNGTRPGTFYDLVLVQRVTDTGTVIETLVFTSLPRGIMAANSSAPQEYSFRLPEGMRGAGKLKVTVTIDYANQIFEYNAGGSSTAENNNVANLNATAALAPYADLKVTSLAVTPNTGVQSGDLLTITWNASNTGTGPVSSAFHDHVTIVNTTTGQTLTTAWDPLESTCRHASLSIL